MFRPIRLLMISSAWLPFCAFAGPADYVYYPSVEYGEREIDFKAGSSKLADDAGRFSAASLGFGLGATPYWFTEVYLKYQKEPGERNRSDLCATGLPSLSSSVRRSGRTSAASYRITSALALGAAAADLVAHRSDRAACLLLTRTAIRASCLRHASLRCRSWLANMRGRQPRPRRYRLDRWNRAHRTGQGSPGGHAAAASDHWKQHRQLSACGTTKHGQPSRIRSALRPSRRAYRRRRGAKRSS